MPLGQAHEQNNDGWWQNLSKPGSSVSLRKFIAHTLKHEQGHASQEAFKKQVTNMCDVIVTIGNLFIDSSNELITLENHDCMNETVVQILHSMKHLGNEHDVLIERKISIHKAIKKNQLPLFKCHHFTTTNSKAK